jgi:hypothetical protein
MDRETKDDNTTMQDAEGDAEMTLSKVGTKDPYLKDLVERECINLPLILEQWKRQGVHNVPIERLDHIQYFMGGSQSHRKKAHTRGNRTPRSEIR